MWWKHIKAMFYRIKVNIIKFLQFNTQWNVKKTDNVTRCKLRQKCHQWGYQFDVLNDYLNAKSRRNKFALTRWAVFNIYLQIPILKYISAGLFCITIKWPLSVSVNSKWVRIVSLANIFSIFQWQDFSSERTKFFLDRS